MTDFTFAHPFWYSRRYTGRWTAAAVVYAQGNGEQTAWQPLSVRCGCAGATCISCDFV